MHQAAQQGMDMNCIDVPVSGYHSLSRHWLTILQAQLASIYIEQLKAINSSPQFEGRAIIHTPFFPPHHVLRASHSSSKHCKVYFFMPKGISYDTIQNSSVFYPGRFTSGSYIVTPKLPPSYTIVPLNEWGLFTSAALTTGSLVHIHAAGTYWDALGYVIGSSTRTEG